MAELTREQLIEEAKLKIAIAACHLNSWMARVECELFKIALASLEAEPVAYIFKHPVGKLFWSLTDESNKGQSDVMPVYVALPVPVVPEGLVKAVSFYELVKRENPPAETGAWKDAVDWVLKEACQVVNTGIKGD
ncbi:hypothetical protein PS031_03690 [Escherichia albertii]|uniref:hypothetical protein n=1 Tax=Escherichia albertii TaxID=208962 RepID=UPI000CF71F19|nr:hypothetical protein [Escherichia albertii]WDB44062.1 hypothetical protein PS031_03690 [Escherichia albertii]